MTRLLKSRGRVTGIKRGWGGVVGHIRCLGPKHYIASAQRIQHYDGEENPRNLTLLCHDLA